MFKDGLIDNFWQKPLTNRPFEEERSLIELAIRQHNKLALPKDIEEDKKVFCNILRDADKMDIFRVACDTPYEVRMTSARLEKDELPAREEIMQCVYEHRAVPRMKNRTEFEAQIAGCAMAFELVFPKSIEIANRQGYITEMLSYEPKGPEQKRQMEELRKEMAYLC